MMGVQVAINNCPVCGKAPTYVSYYLLNGFSQAQIACGDSDTGVVHLVYNLEPAPMSNREMLMTLVNCWNAFVVGYLSAKTPGAPLVQTMWDVSSM